MDKSSKLIAHFYQSRFLSTLVPTLRSRLNSELHEGWTVLDLGCGPESPVSKISQRLETIGVEPFEAYAATAQQNATHDTIIVADAYETLKSFEDRSIDCVVLLEVIEHLPRAVGERLLNEAERVARKKIIVSTPNGFVPQRELDGNPLQVHLSGWTVKDFKTRSFRVRGLAGPKILRCEVQDLTSDRGLLTSIRFQPRLLWFLVATLLAPLTFFIPSVSFGLFAVREKSLGSGKS